MEEWHTNPYCMPYHPNVSGISRTRTSHPRGRRAHNEYRNIFFRSAAMHSSLCNSWISAIQDTLGLVSKSVQLVHKLMCLLFFPLSTQIAASYIHHCCKCFIFVHTLPFKWACKQDCISNTDASAMQSPQHNVAMRVRIQLFIQGYTQRPRQCRTLVITIQCIHILGNICRIICVRVTSAIDPDTIRDDLCAVYVAPRCNLETIRGECEQFFIAFTS